MSTLVPYDTGHLIPYDWRHVGKVVALPGCYRIGSGPYALVITKQGIAVCTRDGITKSMSLRAVSDVSTKQFQGYLIKEETSIGETIAPAPGNGWGIEILFNQERLISAKWKLLCYGRNRAEEWEEIIRNAALEAQGPGDDNPIQSRDD